jgi:catechol 2,3-dioxygenase-like lactoylglutathione lyase family enzyme
MATKTKRRSKAKTTRPKRARGRPVRHVPETLRLRECSVSLTVSDLTASTAWYRDVLGFTLGEQWEEDGAVRGVQMKAGRVDLMLNQDDFAHGKDRAKGEGFRLWCSTIQDLDALAERVRQRGGTLEYGPSDMPWGDRAFAVSDPDGYHITVVEAL